MKKLMACSLLVGTGLMPVMRADDATVTLTVGEDNPQTVQLSGPNLTVDNVVSADETLGDVSVASDVTSADQGSVSEDVSTSGDMLVASSDESASTTQQLTDGEFSAIVSQNADLVTIQVNLPGLDVSTVDLQVVQDKDSARPYLLGMQKTDSNTATLDVGTFEEQTGPTSPAVMETAQTTVENSTMVTTDILANGTTTEDVALTRSESDSAPTGFILALPEDIDPNSMTVETSDQTIIITFAFASVSSEEQTIAAEDAGIVSEPVSTESTQSEFVAEETIVPADSSVSVETTSLTEDTSSSTDVTITEAEMTSTDGGTSMDQVVSTEPQTIGITIEVPSQDTVNVDVTAVNSDITTEAASTEEVAA